MPPSFPKSTHGATPCLLGGPASGWSRQVYARATGLRQPDGYRLFRGPRSMLPFADMVHFFPNEFARLSRG
jgi:hypothetical protein